MAAVAEAAAQPSWHCCQQLSGRKLQKPFSIHTQTSDSGPRLRLQSWLRRLLCLLLLYLTEQQNNPKWPRLLLLLLIFAPNTRNVVPLLCQRMMA